MVSSTPNSDLSVFSWVQNMLGGKHKVDGAIGTVWGSANNEGREAFSSGQMNSQAWPEARPVRVAFRNKTPVPLILCWISEHGKPFHFYSLPPSSLEGPKVTQHDKCEKTVEGHAFALACIPEEVAKKCKKKRHLDPKMVVGGYRPDCVSQDSSTDRRPVHLVTITQRPKRTSFCCLPAATTTPRRYQLRKRKKDEENEEAFQDEQEENTSTDNYYDDDDDDDDFIWEVTAIETVFESANMVDTSKKVYHESTLADWPARLEPNWYGKDEKAKERLIQDIACAAKCLPEHARDYLRSNTPLWVNQSLQYGPESCPINGRGMCFHPSDSKSWLQDNCMTPGKCNGVELYNIQEYCRDCNYWGRGGLLIHELSHAYHNKVVPDGYGNQQIIDCFDQAMNDGLYDSVPVHGPQGPKAKAYACTNPMEYFAELSTAFLGGTDEAEEFNKWFPFNRQQLKEHDPRAYRMLQEIWKLPLEEEQTEEAKEP